MHSFNITVAKSRG